MNALSTIAAVMTKTAAATVLLTFGTTGRNQGLPSTPAGLGADSVQGSKIVFVNDWNGRDAPDEIYAMNADGTNPRRLTVTAAGNNLFPRWSPNGRRIAFNSDRDGRHQIYLMNTDGTGLSRLTTGEGAHATWSPDGERIAFTSRSSDAARANGEIWVINTDGTGLLRLTDTAGEDSHPDWSPDGLRIAFVSNRDGNAEIYVMHADGTAPVRLTFTAAVENGPDWSPDGQKIAFDSNRDGNREIYVMNPDGTEQVRLTSDTRVDAWPSWSPDGRKIAFTRQVEVVPGLRLPNGSDIFVMNADGSEQTRVTHTAPAAFSAFPSWGPGQVTPLGFTSDIQNVTVVGTDYAFGVPAPLTHGLTAFSFENHGKVRHEMNLLWLKEGVTLDSVLRADPGPNRRDLLEGGGVLFAEPGDRSAYRLLVDLVAGRTYLLACTFRDAPDKPQHMELGMFASFEVR